MNPPEHLQEFVDQPGIIWIATRYGISPTHKEWYGIARDMWLSGEYDWRAS